MTEITPERDEKSPVAAQPVSENETADITDTSPEGVPLTSQSLITRLRALDLRYYRRNMVVIVCASIMLFAYFLMSPWMQFNAGAFAGLLASGDSRGQSFQLPQGAGGQTGSTKGFQLPAIPIGQPGGSAEAGDVLGSRLSGRLQSLGQFGVPLAAAVALALAIFTLFKPQYHRLVTGLTFVAGLGGLVFYVIFFVQDAVVPIDLIKLATTGFWLGLVADTGLLFQIIIPNPHPEVEGVSDVGNFIPEIKRTGRSGLSLGQNLRVAIDALLANKLRSGLTMLGVIIGVASVVALLSVGQGAQSSITKQIEGTGVNQVTVSQNVGGFGPGGGGGASSTGSLTYNDAEAIARNVKNIKAVLPQYSGTLIVRSDQENIQTSVLGSTYQYASVRNIDVEVGRFFNQNEYKSESRVAVLGNNAAADLFGGLNPLNREIRIDGVRFKVVGVLAEQDGGFGANPNDQVYVPLTTAYRNLFSVKASGSNKNRVSSIIVDVENRDVVDQVKTDIETIIREEHKLKADEDNDFSITDQSQLLETASSITGILTVLLGAIASISLLVGGIGIMNIMLVSVTERTKEIGLRKAIGARRTHILQQFLIETVFLSLLGGFLGVLLGVGIAALVNTTGLLTTTVTWQSIALGLGFSAIIGIFFGVYPASQAAALQPIEALRYE